MLRNILITLCLTTVNTVGSAQTLMKSQILTTHLFSAAPIEDIRAESNTGVSLLDVNTGSVFFKIPIRSFEFEKKLMQEHFNEDYLESDRYPDAEFRGRILDKPDLSRDGTFLVRVDGTLTIHGVSRKYSTSATIRVRDGSILADSTFPVKTADHRIKIPKLVIKNIGENIRVTVSAAYKPIGS